MDGFDELEVLRLKFFLRDVCIGLPSLKKACKYQAIHGIILSLLFFLLGVVGGYFLVTGLGSAATLGYGVGAALLVVGTLLLIYNLLLLSSVRNNNGTGVFKIIKVGCLILLYLGIFTMLGGVIWLADRGSDPTPAGGLIGGLVLGIFLTSLAIFGIHSAKPKIVSLYICIIAIILFMICGVLLLLVAFCRVDLDGFFAAFYGVGPSFIVSLAQSIGVSVPVLIIIITTSSFFAIIIVFWIMDYYFKLFALHVNMMTIAQVTYNLHHQELINV